MHETGVIHGRFQVLHNDHVRYIMAGKARCRHLVVGITNPDPSLTRAEDADPERTDARANPLTYYERAVLVRETLRAEAVPLADFSVVPFPISVPELLHYYVPVQAVFFLTIYDNWGREKLKRFRSLGLETEVLWERPLAEKGLSATAIRRLMATGGPWTDDVPPPVAELLAVWKIPARIRDLG